MSDFLCLDMNSISDQRVLEFLVVKSQEQNVALSIILDTGSDIGSRLAERQKEMRERLQPPQRIRWWENPVLERLA